MYIKLFLVLSFVFSILCLSFSSKVEVGCNAERIPINWVDSLNTDFSFTKDWSYPEGVWHNRFGQLSCQALCSPAIDGMIDENGKIKSSFMNEYYKIVDTSHLFHTFRYEAQAYEWSGSNFILFSKNEDGSVVGKSLCNASTHSSLNIIIKNDFVSAFIHYNSIAKRKELFL